VSVCRLAIQVERGDDCDLIDVAVPAGTPVCLLLPAIVAMVDSTTDPATSVDDWRLDRWSGVPVDDSMTLTDNGIRDGELVFLTSRRAPPVGLVQWDPCRTVAVADRPIESSRAIGPAVCVWAAMTASVALAWSGAGAQGWSHVVVAAAASCAAAVMAIANGSDTGLRVAAVCLAAATGFLAVPANPSAANAFLASAAGLSMALLVSRSRPSAALAATATLAGLVAVATVAPLVAPLSVSAVGAVLSTTSLGLLAVAARVAMLAARLRPDEHPDDCETRAALAHLTLTGLVIGCACGAAIGALVVALGCRRPDAPTLAGIGFTAVVGLALALRGRTQADQPRRTAVTVGGLCCFTSSFAIVVGAAPAYAGWTSAVLIAIGLGAIRRRALGPGLARAVEILEYAVLAAVVPLACWVAGVYAIVRESHLL
jgi:type VII secretion integral membrane protein EccD